MGDHHGIHQVALTGVQLSRSTMWHTPRRGHVRPAA